MPVTPIQKVRRRPGMRAITSPAHDATTIDPGTNPRTTSKELRRPGPRLPRSIASEKFDHANGHGGGPTELAGGPTDRSAPNSMITAGTAIRHVASKAR